MSFGSDGGGSSYVPQYEEFKDTPWIKQGRQIASVGGQGILDNYGKVNWFDDATKANIEARNDDVYRRAFGDMEREYMNTMNKYNAANYGRFGTLNATAPYYVTDQYQRDFQRQMNDLAYNKAVNYENLVNNELQRRYNTMDMFHNLYQYGNVPHSVDIANWNTRNTNKDLALAALNAQQGNSGGFGNILSALGTATAGMIGGMGGQTGTTMLGNQLGSNIGSGIGGIQ